MGTRSITTVYEHTAWDDVERVEPVVCIYRQMDGYPSGHGADLFWFLEGMEVVNGFGLNPDNKKRANGAGCLAAQLVAELKDGIGGIYLYHCDEDGKVDAGQDYEYEIHITFNHPEIRVVCKNGWDKTTLFDGNVLEFGNFCTIGEEE